MLLRYRDYNYDTHPVGKIPLKIHHFVHTVDELHSSHIRSLLIPDIKVLNKVLNKLQVITLAYQPTVD